MKAIMENGMMTITIIKIQRTLLMLLALGAAFFSTPCFAGSGGELPETLYAVIDGLLAATPPLDKASVERLTGAKLVSVQGSDRFLIPNNSFIFYEAHNIKLKDTAINMVDYREPVVGVTATKGPFLYLEFANSCFKREEMTAHYGPMKLKYLIPKTPITYSRSEAWGEVMFSFLADEPYCLTDMVINVKILPRK
jgi:hypothetical protein